MAWKSHGTCPAPHRAGLQEPWAADSFEPFLTAGRGRPQGAALEFLNSAAHMGPTKETRCGASLVLLTKCVSAAARCPASSQSYASTA